MIDASCNSDSSCTDCGVATSFYLTANSTCMACPTLANCLQCDATATATCTLCAYGHYLDSNSDCQACPSGCTTCSSSTVCDVCMSGYTLSLSVTQGECIICIAPCVTCKDRASLCVSCENGYTKKGWKCQNNKHVGFRIQFGSASVSDITSIISQVIERILTIMGQSTDKTEYVSIETIASGSTIVTGTYDEGTATTDSTVSTSSSQL